MREPLGASTLRDRDRPPIAPLIRKAFARTLILNSDCATAELAEATVAEGKADAITFGLPFIANPDLPRRIAKALPLATAVVATFYSRGPEGYVDYPFAECRRPRRLRERGAVTSAVNPSEGCRRSKPTSAANSPQPLHRVLPMEHRFERMVDSVVRLLR